MQNKDDYLRISQLTHAGYCLRRAALIMNEQQWQENADTAKGRIEHDRVHDQRTEKGPTESAFMNKMYARIIWESLGNVI